ncbi:cyclase family protein [Archangium primigenium]|uniref:cyclase family protein n=1 Tax=[Archangium] primigenium TaxID=2792470 RepID=UPI00195973FE|nr:cyclase family protein [Archangium primigenium]MBM7112412.1 cyclase family protein [Archangium primigenium]
MEGAWLDISVPFGEEPPVIVSAPPEGAGEGAAFPDRTQDRVEWLRRAAWMGTYVTAPPSLELDLEDTERLPLNATVGKARVLLLDDVDCIRADSLADYEPRPGERLLLRTRNSTREWWKRPHGEDFVMLSEAAAHLLVERRVACVGVDYVSRAGFHSEALAVHQLLRDAGLWLIEGLDLSEVKVGMHELLCLPLKMKAEWGSPARALVRTLREGA